MNTESLGTVLVFRELIQKDAYVYIDEIAKLKDFNFFPQLDIDIEKPSSVSKEHNLIWMLPIGDSIQKNSYIKDYNVLDKPVKFT